MQNLHQDNFNCCCIDTYHNPLQPSGLFTLLTGTLSEDSSSRIMMKLFFKSYLSSGIQILLLLSYPELMLISDSEVSIYCSPNK